MPDEGGYPRFKYHPNFYDLDILEHFDGTCECCGEKGNVFYQGLHCEEDITYVCLDCIASGRAAEKFHGAFNYDHEHVDNLEAVDVLEHRTPGYLSWQDHFWPACCNDFCAYLGPVGTKELEELGIADDLFEEDGAFEEWEGAREDLEKYGWLSGLLFRCLHCGSYRLIVEAD